MIELYVRFGVCDGEPRTVETFTFATEDERRAFINGMYALHSRVAGEYDITRKLPDGSFMADPAFEDDGVEA